MMDSLPTCTCTLAFVIVQFIPSCLGAALTNAGSPERTLDDAGFLQSSYDQLPNKTLCSTPASPTKAGLKYVRALYGDLFNSQQGHLDMVSKFQEDRLNSLRNQGYRVDDGQAVLNGDGDSCCSTDFFYATNSSLVDVWGQRRSIVHFTSLTPPLYQYIPHARCLTFANSLCKGSCFIEPIHLSILVYDTSSKLGVGFAWFAIPGYCSCKNVTP